MLDGLFIVVQGIETGALRHTEPNRGGAQKFIAGELVEVGVKTQASIDVGRELGGRRVAQGIETKSKIQELARGVFDWRSIMGAKSIG